ncbi:type II toxin-antitoxin system death-on-curing family toxin [Sorangium sp. So ce406]|uniref:type II toxin-antitoxin system death-on-curing family toxin n=1 Tax=Sorangium sp. So ce406 TaxID=3133311 RepID=UPI003F5BABEC
MNEDLSWAFVEIEDVLQLHAAAVSQYGGDQSLVPKAGCVEGSIGSAVTASMYVAEDGEPDLLVAVAYLLVYLAKNHCFTDGNKRVAWSALLRVLDANGIRIVAEQDDAAKLVNDVASGVVDAHGVLNWLSSPNRITAAPGWANTI